MLVYLIGNKESGKTTHANWLVETHGFTRVSFADPIREIAAEILATYDPSLDATDFLEKIFKEPGYSAHKNATIEVSGLRMCGSRKLLQSIGEGACKHIGTKVWVKALTEKIFRLRAKEQNVKIVVDDARKPFETFELGMLGGTGIFLDKPGSDTLGVVTEQCQSYVERGEINPDLSPEFSLGIEGTQGLIEDFLNLLR